MSESECCASGSCEVCRPLLHVEVNTDPPKPPYGSPERAAWDLSSEEIAEERLRARDYEAWADL